MQRPNLAISSTIPPEIARHLRANTKDIYELRSAVNPVIAAQADYLKNSPSDLLTIAQAMQKQLSANGQYPLPVTQLPGLPKTGLVLEGTHAKRLATSPSKLDQGVQWYETDRSALYVTAGGRWVYVTGVMHDLFANRPTDLGVFDDGFEFYATDYGFGEYWNGQFSEWIYLYGEAQVTYSQLLGFGALLSVSEARLIAYASTYKHRHQWTGTQWTFAGGDASQYYSLGPITGISGGVWYPCDGSAHLCSNGDGTSESSIPTQNWNVVAAMMSGGYATAKVVGLPPTWSTNVSTGADAPALQVVQSGTGANVPAEPHTHPYAISGANAPINIPSETNGGLPDHYTTSLFLRA